jgi:hypothetical protein
MTRLIVRRLSRKARAGPGAGDDEYVSFSLSGDRR